MKVCTITCHHATNHGAMLQAYALLIYLNDQGYEVEIIDYLPDYLKPRTLFYQNPKFKKIGLGWLYAIIKFFGNYSLAKREHVFERFFKKHLQLTKTHYDNIEQLRYNPPSVDVYIAGSDQIWNTTFRNGMDSAFYLDFGSSEVVRLSYAASFATDSISVDKRDFVKTNLSRFDSISVRESSAVQLTKELGYDSVQVVDPVFLLTVDEWDTLIENDKSEVPDFVTDEEYIFVYDFLNDDGIKAIAIRLAQLYKCKIYSTFHNDYADKIMFYNGPTSFVHTIKNARCVISNSFHGTAFSMIYKKDFFVVKRGDGLNTRMQDLLEHYHLSERLIDQTVSDECIISKIDYSCSNSILAEDIAFSKKWLINNITK